MLDPAFLTHGTPLEYARWTLVLIAVLLLWLTVAKGNGTTLVIHLLIIGVLIYAAMSAHPAHAQFVSHSHRVVLTPVPLPKARPAVRNQACDNQCKAIGKAPGCAEKRLCYEGITR